MKFNLKNRPKYQEGTTAGTRIANTLVAYDKWFEGFEKNQRSFEESKLKTIEWLQKNTMISDNLTLTLGQAAIRSFILKEVLGE